MDTKFNYTLVGFFVVVLTIGLIAGFLWLTSVSVNKDYLSYLIYMKEDVSGLSVNGPVRFNGVKVGYIESIALNKKNPQQVILKVQIEEDVPITQSTVATLMTEGITGIDYLGLKNTTPHAERLKAKPTSPYPVIPSAPSLFIRLGTALEDITASFKSLSGNMGRFFDEQNRQAASAFLESATRVTEQMPAVLNAVTATGEKTQIALQSFTDQILPETEILLRKLNTISENMEVLTNELQQNPAILLRGKKPPPLGPGEK